MFMWIVGITVTVFCGAMLTMASSYGATKQQVEETKGDVLQLQRRSVDYVYIQDLIQSNYLLVDILKATPNSKEMDEAMKEWKDFQLSTVRRANPTRGGSASTSNSMK
jgi:hypothetical protein